MRVGEGPKGVHMALHSRRGAPGSWNPAHSPVTPLAVSQGSRECPTGPWEPGSQSLSWTWPYLLSRVLEL